MVKKSKERSEDEKTPIEKCLEKINIFGKVPSGFIKDIDKREFCINEYHPGQITPSQSLNLKVNKKGEITVTDNNINKVIYKTKKRLEKTDSNIKNMKVNEVIKLNKIDPNLIPINKLPIYISPHSEKRMKERLNCNTSKYNKIAKKALKSKDKINKELYTKIMNAPNARQNDVYKYYLGYIFIFRIMKRNGVHNISLITVYNPKHENDY